MKSFITPTHAYFVNFLSIGVRLWRLHVTLNVIYLWQKTEKSEIDINNFQNQNTRDERKKKKIAHKHGKKKRAISQKSKAYYARLLNINDIFWRNRKQLKWHEIYCVWMIISNMAHGNQLLSSFNFHFTKFFSSLSRSLALFFSFFLSVRLLQVAIYLLSFQLLSLFIHFSSVCRSMARYYETVEKYSPFAFRDINTRSEEWA